MKKSTSSKRAKREYDLDRKVMKMTKGGKEYEFAFDGLPSNVYMKLAMIGAGQLLYKVDKPLVLWEKICQNRFGRERDYARVPKLVHAYALVESIPIEKAIKQYKDLTKKERVALKSNVDIRKQLLQMQLDELQ